MERYHVNDKGEINPCQAEYGFCPISTSDGHEPTREATQKAYETFMENLQNPKKSVKFNFTNGQEKHVFTEADCAHLSRTIAKSANLPIFYLGDKEADDSSVNNRRWSHFVNQLPDGRFIDVEGIWTEKDLLKRWHIDELGREWMPNSVNSAEIDDLRKMGVRGQMFTETKPAKTLMKMRKHLEPLINLH